MRPFFLALLGMVEILWRDWKGGREKQTPQKSCSGPM